MLKEGDQQNEFDMDISYSIERKKDYFVHE